ncbi:MAG: hypothetical protein ACPG7E_04720 [Marinirhabdus sp.]
MSFSITYKPLVTVNLYHHYLLDDGTTAFTQDETFKAQRLQAYNFNEFATLAPSKKTAKALTDNHLVFVQTNTGFVIFSKALEDEENPGTFNPFVALGPELQLQFLLKVHHPLFENFSTSGANPALPYLLGNTVPATEAPDFDLIEIDSLAGPNPLPAMNENTYKNIQQGLEPRETVGLFGIIALAMQGETGTHNVTNANGSLKASPTVFKIQLDNRETVWHYYSADGSTLLHDTTPDTLPIVKRGVVGHMIEDEEYPAASADRILFEKDENGNITKTISEIYIN